MSITSRATPATLRPTRRWSILLLALLLLALLLLAACGGAYAEAVSRGDELAEAGMWDEAAAAYERAVKIDPEDPEAKTKLADVRRRQAAARLERAQALEQRGEIAAALALVQEAAKLDPNNTEAQKALTRISDSAVRKAESLAGDGKLREAYELTTLVLKGSPNHPKARQLDEQIRTELAQQAYDRAQKFLEADQRGNALVELAACLTYRPDYPDAKLHFGKVKLELETSLRYFVVLERFDATGTAAAIGKGLSPDLVKQSFDERLLLRVVDKLPKEAEKQPGVVVKGNFDAYDYHTDKRTESHNCDYVCGTESKPNPNRDSAERDVATAEQNLERYEREVADDEKKVAEYQKEVDRLGSDVQRKEQDADRARSDLDRCQQNAKPGDTSACSSERSRSESAQRSLESERQRVSSPMNSLTSARSDLQRSQEDRNRAREQKARTTETLRNTPPMITVDKFCPFNYDVQIHSASAKVTIKLTMDKLGEGSILKDQPFKYEEAGSDATRPAHPNRCPEVAGSDPLTLPSEADMRKALLNKVVFDVRAKVVASYDSYRQGFLAAARRHETAGQTDEAVEAYVRYVLTGPHQLDKKDQIGAFLSKTKGIGKLDALWTL